MDLSLISPGWKTVQLGDPTISRMMSGGTPDRTISAYFGGDIRWVNSGELDDGWMLDTEEKITLAGLENLSARLFPSETLVAAMYGATVGKTAILKVEAATNQAICAVIPKNDSFDCQFMQFCLMLLRPALLRARAGGAQPNINKQILSALVVPLPPIREQRAIARALRAVQQAKEDRRREAALERERKAALMEHLFTHGTHGEATKQTEIGEMPTSWNVALLEQITQGMQYGLSIRGNEQGQYPILRMNNLVEGFATSADLQYVDLEEPTFQQFKLNQGDVLFNRTNSFDLVGRTGLFDLAGEYVFASYLIRVIPDQERLSPAFLSRFFNWRRTQDRLKGLASRAVSQSNISAGKPCAAVPNPDGNRKPRRTTGRYHS